MEVELTVVGIRNYCEGGKAGYPQLFARLKAGTKVFLEVDPPESKYPGALSVYDGEMNKIGSISKTDRRYIELDVKQRHTLEAFVTRHSAEHNCLWVKADNCLGFNQPYIRHIDKEPQEMLFHLTPGEERLIRIARRVRAFVDKWHLNDDPLPAEELEELVSVAQLYQGVCCTSLDGENSFLRADLLHLLDKYRAMDEERIGSIHSVIYEQHKDLGRTPSDVKVRVNRAHYEQILQLATTVPTGRQQAPIEDYVKSLEFVGGGRLTMEALEEEKLRLSRRLAEFLENKYTTYADTEEGFADAVYALNYDLQSLHLMHCLRIKLERISALIEEVTAAGAHIGEKSAAGALIEPEPWPQTPGVKKTQLFVHEEDEPRVVDWLCYLVEKYYNKERAENTLWEEDTKCTRLLVTAYYVLVKHGITIGVVGNNVVKAYHELLSKKCRFDFLHSRKTYETQMNCVIRMGKEFHKLTPKMFTDLTPCFTSQQFATWSRCFEALERELPEL
ncbi:MAG: hypothetical protein ACI4C3_05265 [Bacteroides sp.]